MGAPTPLGDLTRFSHKRLAVPLCRAKNATVRKSSSARDQCTSHTRWSSCGTVIPPRLGCSKRRQRGLVRPAQRDIVHAYHERQHQLPALHPKPDRLHAWRALAFVGVRQPYDIERGAASDPTARIRAAVSVSSIGQRYMGETLALLTMRRGGKLKVDPCCRQRRYYRTQTWLRNRGASTSGHPLSWSFPTRPSDCRRFLAPSH